MIEVKVEHRAAGAPHLLTSLAAEYILDAPELIWQRTEEQAIACIRESIERYNRLEVSVLDSGVLVGVAVVVPDDDDHVGPCLAVQWRFISRSHRGIAGIRLQRAILGIAKRLNYNVLAYTKRTGLGTYQVRYVQTRLHNGKEDFKGAE